jgi:hypothetical protein
MKIHLDIANGYRDTKIAQIRLDNPSWTDEQINAQFVDDVYGNWIRTNLSSDFTVCDVTGNNFRIDFAYEDDANAFRRANGGRVVED